MAEQEEVMVVVVDEPIVVAYRAPKRARRLEQSTLDFRAVVPSPPPPPSSSSVVIEGLTLLLQSITIRQERDLLRAVDGGCWSMTLQRRTQQFGYRYDYRGTDVLEPVEPLPAYCDELLSAWFGTEGPLTGCERPQQLIINEYLPGQGIGAHVDAPIFGPVIFGLSLGGGCLMEFVRVKETALPSAVGTGGGTGGGTVQVFLPPRSLLILRGAARSAWSHRIVARKNDTLVNGTRSARTRRISLTFRTVVVRTAL